MFEMWATANKLTPPPSFFGLGFSQKRKRARGDVLSKSQSDSLSDEYTDPSPSHVRAGPGPNTKRRRTFRSSAPPVSFSNTVLSAAGGQLPLRPSGLFEPFVEIESSVNAPGRRAWSGEPSGIAPDAARPDNIDSEEEEEGDLALSELEGDGDTPGQLEARGPRHRTGPDSGLEGVSYAETSRSSNRHRFDMSVVPDSELSRAAGGLHSQGQISSTNSSGLADVHAVEQSQQQSSIYIAMPPLREPTSGASHAGRMPLQPLAVEAFEPFLDADHGLLLDAAGVPIWDRSTNAGNSSDTSNSRPRRPVEESVHSTHEPSSPVEHFSSPGPPPPQEPPRRKPLARVGGWIVPSPPPREQPLQASSSRLPFPPSEQSIDDALRRTANEETDTHLDHPRAGDAELEIHSFSDVLADPPEPSQNAPNKSQGALTAERGHDAESAPRASTPPLGATARRSGPPLPAPSQTIASEPPSQTRWADAEQETQQSGPSSDNSSLTFSQLAAQPSSRGARRRIITLLHASPWVPSTLKEEVERFVSRARSAAGASGESSITAETEDDSETQEDGLLRTKPTWVLELARTNADGEQVPDRAVAAAAGHAEEGEGEADDLCLVLVLVVSTEEGTFDVQELTEKLVKPLREDPRYSPWHDGECAGQAEGPCCASYARSSNFGLTAAGRRLPKSSLRSSGATSAAAVVGNSGEMEVRIALILLLATASSFLQFHVLIARRTLLHRPTLPANLRQLTPS